MKEVLDGIIVCEGKYDKIKLESLFIAPIITTEGFGVFKNKEIINVIKGFGENKKIFIVTDSDVAGFRIRTYLKNTLRNYEIIHICIPDYYGKEKRKTKISAEGKLGVEGVPKEVLLQLFSPYLALEKWGEKKNENEITKQDLYFTGLVGGEGAREKKQKLLATLNFPERISTNLFLQLLNTKLTREELYNLTNNDNYS